MRKAHSVSQVACQVQSGPGTCAWWLFGTLTDANSGSVTLVASVPSTGRAIKSSITVYTSRKCMDTFCSTQRMPSHSYKALEGCTHRSMLGSRVTPCLHECLHEECNPWLKGAVPVHWDGLVWWLQLLWLLQRLSCIGVLDSPFTLL